MEGYTILLRGRRRLAGPHGAGAFVPHVESVTAIEAPALAVEVHACDEYE
jgi:hypothetical protein